MTAEKPPAADPNTPRKKPRRTTFSRLCLRLFDTMLALMLVVPAWMLGLFFGDAVADALLNLSNALSSALVNFANLLL